MPPDAEGSDLEQNDLKQSDSMRNLSHMHPVRKHPLPHERDQSTEDQKTGVRSEIDQARKDIESGQKDTDLRGTPGLDRTRP